MSINRLSHRGTTQTNTSLNHAPQNRRIDLNIEKLFTYFLESFGSLSMLLVSLVSAIITIE
jgi:hypothetical protein